MPNFIGILKSRSLKNHPKSMHILCSLDEVSVKSLVKVIRIQLASLVINLQILRMTDCSP